MSSFVNLVLPFILMIGIFYLLIFLPESKRRKKYSSMLGSLKTNDEVLTKGGIIGKVVNIQDDFVIIQSGPDRARLKLSKDGIASVRNSSETENK